MITKITLANTSKPSHNNHFFYVVRTFKSNSLSNFQVYNTVLLAIITMLYIRSPELMHILNWKFILFDQRLTISPIPQPLVTTILLSVSTGSAF